MSTDNKIISDTLIMYPAARRAVKYYNSRVQSEDSIRRPIQTGVVVNRDYPGSFIWDYKVVDAVNSEGVTTRAGLLTSIEFFIGGYYIKVNDSAHPTSNPGLLSKVNSLVGSVNRSSDVQGYKSPQSGKTLWVWIDSRDDVSPSPTISGTYSGTSYKGKIAEFLEVECADTKASTDEECFLFTGLAWGEQEPDTDLKIPLVVPKDGETGPSGLNPGLDGSPEGEQWLYKPWFRSSASWAASKFSDKNKIWIDEIYDVPHVCVIALENKRKWIPLGAVYKSSNH